MKAVKENNLYKVPQIGSETKYYKYAYDNVSTIYGKYLFTSPANIEPAIGVSKNTSIPRSSGVYYEFYLAIEMRVTSFYYAGWVVTNTRPAAHLYKLEVLNPANNSWVVIYDGDVSSSSGTTVAVSNSIYSNRYRVYLGSKQSYSSMGVKSIDMYGDTKKIVAGTSSDYNFYVTKPVLCGIGD